MIALTAPARWFGDHFGSVSRAGSAGGSRWGWRSRWRRSRPQAAGVREPRRPRPTLPAAAVALAEPRTQLRHRIRLHSQRN